MYKKKIIFLIVSIFLITSCDTVRQSLEGGKKKTSDEFLIKKKDPLILPPDFESLPSPAERQIAQEGISTFEKTLKETSLNEEEVSSSSSSSAEESILKQIRKK